MSPGQISTFWISFRNVGTETWTRGTWGRQVNLALNGDNKEPFRLGMAANWLWDDRIATTTQPVVAPGDIGMFTFSVRAPLDAGTYSLNLRPVVDGTGWMEDEGVFWTIAVVPAATVPTAPRPTPSPISATTPQLRLSATAAQPGGAIIVSWSGIANPTAKDWVGLFPLGAADSAYVNAYYTDGTSAGTGTHPIPLTAAPGTYEFRLFSNDSLVRIATSASLIITAATRTPAPTAPPIPTPSPTIRPSTPTPQPVGVSGNPWGFNFDVGVRIYAPPSAFCNYFSCIANFWNGRGYVIQCRDGMFSLSGGISGSCSYHGGNLRPLYAPF